MNAKFQKRPEKVPSAMIQLGEPVMSNYDHQICQDIAEQINDGRYAADYPGWNFHATVWRDGELFKAQIMQYGNHTATIESETLQGIMELASDAYGYD